MDTEERPVRYCHGCGQYDDHPRYFDIGDASNPADDKLYHYDCIPDEVKQRAIDDPENTMTADHPALVATANGLRGQDVAQTVVDSDLVPNTEPPTPSDDVALQQEA